MTRQHTLRSQLQELEPRETPAVFVNPTTLTYRDVDGDNVTVRFSKPILTAVNAPTIFTFDSAFGTLTGQQLQTINLTSVAAAAGGTTITTTALRSPVNGGDGFAALGQINATGIDLGAVNIDGDLGRIVAGNAITTTPGLASLTVASLGRFGTNTGATNLVTSVTGRLGSLTVKGDVKEAFVDVQGVGDGDIGAVNIAGALLGGAAANSGRINASGDIGLVTIRGSVASTSGDFSGYISAAGKLSGVTIGGDLQGGTGDTSGAIFSNGAMGAVKITGDVVGSTGPKSGYITSNGDLASVSIGGNMQGGNGILSGAIESYGTLGAVKIAGDVVGVGLSSGKIQASTSLGSVTIGGDMRGGISNGNGRIFSFGTIGAVKIAGDVFGGNGSSSGLVSADGSIASVIIGGSLVGGPGYRSGRIFSGGLLGSIKVTGNLVGGSASTGNLEESGIVQAQRIGTLTIGGSLIAGTDTTPGTFSNNGAIRVVDDIGSITIGNIIGNATNSAIISARGKANLPATATSDVAIGSLRVLGRVEYAQIIAGVDVNGVAKNADAQIGAVTVGGDWIASSLVAGAIAGNGLFGDTGDAKMAGGGIKDVATLSSRITSLTIAGQAYGTFAGSDHFGIVAENIGTVKVGGTTIPTTAGNGNDDIALGITGDFRVNEV